MIIIPKYHTKNIVSHVIANTFALLFIWDTHTHKGHLEAVCYTSRK